MRPRVSFPTPTHASSHLSAGPMPDQINMFQECDLIFFNESAVISAKGVAIRISVLHFETKPSFKINCVFRPS